MEQFMHPSKHKQSVPDQLMVARLAQAVAPHPGKGYGSYQNELTLSPIDTTWRL